MKRMGAALVFLAELGMLAGLALWGWQLVDGAWGIALAVALPTGAAALWAAYLSPKAPSTMPQIYRMLLRFDLLLLGAAAGYFSGARVLGIVTAGLALVGTAMARGLDRRAVPAPIATVTPPGDDA